MNRFASLIVLLLAACSGGSGGADMSLFCESCPMGSVCVQSFDANCSATLECVPATLTCPPGTCVENCEQTFCLAPTQCKTRKRCGGEIPAAFTCYAP